MTSNICNPYNPIDRPTGRSHCPMATPLGHAPLRYMISAAECVALHSHAQRCWVARLSLWEKSSWHLLDKLCVSMAECAFPVSFWCSHLEYRFSFERPRPVSLWVNLWYFQSLHHCGRFLCCLLKRKEKNDFEDQKKLECFTAENAGYTVDNFNKTLGSVRANDGYGKDRIPIWYDWLNVEK